MTTLTYAERVQALATIAAGIYAMYAGPSVATPDTDRVTRLSVEALDALEAEARKVEPKVEYEKESAQPVRLPGDHNG